MGYANVTTLKIQTYLYNTYAIITNGGLEDNKKAIAASYNVSVPIKTLYKRIEESVQYTASANTPFATAQVVSTAFCVI